MSKSKSKSKSKGTIIINDEELKESLKEKIGYILTNKIDLIHLHENENLTLEKELQKEGLDLIHLHELLLLAFKQTHPSEEALRNKNSYYITKRGTPIQYITDRGNILGKHKDEIEIYKKLKEKLEKLEKQLTNEKNLQNTNNKTKRENLQKKHKDEMYQIDQIELLSKKIANKVDNDKLLRLEKPINQLYSRILLSQVDTFVLTGRLGGSTRQKKRILKVPTKGKAVKAVKAKAKKPVRSVNKATK